MDDGDGVGVFAATVPRLPTPRPLLPPPPAVYLPCLPTCLLSSLFHNETPQGVQMRSSLLFGQNPTRKPCPNRLRRTVATAFACLPQHAGPLPRSPAHKPASQPGCAYPPTEMICGKLSDWIRPQERCSKSNSRIIHHWKTFSSAPEIERAAPSVASVKCTSGTEQVVANK